MDKQNRCFSTAAVPEAQIPYHFSWCDQQLQLAVGTLCHKNISQAKGGGNSGEDLEDNSLLLVIPLLVIQCGVVSYSCLPNSPLSSPPWLDLDAACIHHCIA